MAEEEGRVRGEEETEKKGGGRCVERRGWGVRVA
jgi:hypothetical protein